MPKINGFDEALKLLQGLSPAESKKLIDEIGKQDLTLALALQKQMVKMEDLQYLTPAMLVGLLRDVDLEEFGVALKTVDKEVTQKLLGMVSTGIRLDIEDGLNGKPRRVSEVNEIQAKILEIVRKKVDQGHLVLDPEGDTLV